MSVNNFLTFHSAFTTVMRSSGVTSGIKGNDFDWHTQPYYREASEGQPNFPWCVYNIPPSTVQHTIGNQGRGYLEEFKLEVWVEAYEDLIERVSSPYGSPNQSVLAYLDSIEDSQPFDSAFFEVTQFQRDSYEISLEDSRGPGTGRVWKGTGIYSVALTIQYPTRNSRSYPSQ